MDEEHRAWLTELTALPTAPGREDRVIAWVRRWVSDRPQMTLEADRFGNLLIRSVRNADAAAAADAAPIYFTAHMDHPAFVVRDRVDDQHVLAEFRGGVAAEYFVDSKVLLYHDDALPQRGVVIGLEHDPESAKSASSGSGSGAPRGEKVARIRFDARVVAEPGDVLMWDVGRTRARGDRFHARACDDLAGVAAALSVLDVVTTAQDAAPLPDLRVLLTRAEEVGFVGAIAAAKSEQIPRNARLICLEASKSFAESPIGAGPIVRVGDRTSTFDPDLTYRVSRVASALAEQDETFAWQRKLMPGGTCEASAFCAFGYTATCLCLALGNYHNMSKQPGRIAAEIISLRDYANLVRLLAAIAGSLDEPARAPHLRQVLEDLFTRRAALLGSA